MSAKAYYPGISVEGWTNSSLTVADKLISDFFLSEYSQTFEFVGDVSSFPWIIQKYKENPSELGTVVQETLVKYFLRYFNEVDISVVAKNVPKSINGISLEIFLEFTDSSGERFSLSRLVETEDSTIRSISNIIDKGN